MTDQPTPEDTTMKILKVTPIPQQLMPYPFTQADLNERLKGVGAAPIELERGRNEASAILDLISEIERLRADD